MVAEVGSRGRELCFRIDGSEEKEKRNLRLENGEVLRTKGLTHPRFWAVTQLRNLRTEACLLAPNKV